MDGILHYLQQHGQRLDSEIAKDFGISLQQARLAITNLSAGGDVLVCHSIQFNEGKRTEAILCRVSGYIPPASPGRKPKR
jgi:predicted ArsR family transcriptional regulator